MLICHRCALGNCSHYRERLKRESWESCEHQSTPRASRDCVLHKTTFPGPGVSCAVVSRAPQQPGFAALNKKLLWNFLCSGRVDCRWEGGVSEVPRERMRGFFYLDSWISLEWSGNVGRKILLYGAVLLCVCAALCIHVVLPKQDWCRGESSPRSFLGREFLFNTGRTLKEPSLGRRQRTLDRRGTCDRQTVIAPLHRASPGVLICAAPRP